MDKDASFCKPRNTTEQYSVVVVVVGKQTKPYCKKNSSAVNWIVILNTLCTAMNICKSPSSLLIQTSVSQPILEGRNPGISEPLHLHNRLLGKTGMDCAEIFLPPLVLA